MWRRNVILNQINMHRGVACCAGNYIPPNTIITHPIHPDISLFPACCDLGWNDTIWCRTPRITNCVAQWKLTSFTKLVRQRPSAKRSKVGRWRKQNKGIKKPGNKEKNYNERKIEMFGWTGAEQAVFFIFFTLKDLSCFQSEDWSAIRPGFRTDWSEWRECGRITCQLHYNHK